MVPKLRIFAGGVRLYRNWPTWLAYKLHRSRGAHEEIMVLRNGIRFATRFERNEPGTIDDIFIRGDYDAYKAAVPVNGTVIDIGANIGAFSVAVAVGVPGVRVFSYEPAPDTFMMLQKNIALNHLGDRAKAFNVAVAGENGERVLSEDPSNSGLASLVFGRDNGTIKSGLVSHTVKTTTLADIFHENNINRCDFLKMDCEGAEFEIIEKTPDAVIAKIGAIGMEYHGDPSPIERRLQNLGFAVSCRPAGPAVGILSASQGYSKIEKQ